MVDYNKELVSALESVLPTHYEMALTAGEKVPCISYQERNNYVSTSGNTIGYSRVIFTIKIWANSMLHWLMMFCGLLASNALLLMNYTI